MANTTRQYGTTTIAANIGSEEPSSASVGLDLVSSLRFDETKLNALLNLVTGIRFERAKGDGQLYGLVKMTWAPLVASDVPIVKARKTFVSAYMSPAAGDEIAVPFSVIAFSDLFRLPAAKAFKSACPAGQETQFGQAFLIAVTIASIEGGNLELSSFSSETAKDHFLRLTAGSTAEKSTPGSRMVQALDQRKLSEAQADLKSLAALYCMYTWCASALFGDAKSYALAVSSLSELISSYVSQCLPEGKPPLMVTAEYVLRHRLVTSQEKALVTDFVESRCLGTLSSSASGLGRHSEAVRIIKERISLHKNRTLFLKRKGGAERAAAIARLVPAFRDDTI